MPPTYSNSSSRAGARCVGRFSSRESEWASEESSLREESSINSRGQNMPRGGQSSCAERREKPREQGIGRRRRRRRSGRGRGERRDRGGSDRRENDESGTTARWHEGRSENRRETAKGDRKRQTPKGLGWATPDG